MLAHNLHVEQLEQYRSKLQMAYQAEHNQENQVHNLENQVLHYDETCTVSIHVPQLHQSIQRT